MNKDISLNRIRLELARMSGFPAGSPWHGYEFVAPLTADGRVDHTAWNELKEMCHVTRFWGDEPDEHGRFVHAASGWCFKYSQGSEIKRESLFKLDRHRFTPGGYVTVTEPDGEQRAFRIVAMTPALVA
ncbi:MAG TPA: hypothetical protein VMU22_04075 [Rhizomicrobium sp.]|nr:hypothetical protein [Rhizomicrobium sp.]